MGSSIYADNIRELQETFQLFDLDRNGAISAAELTSVLARLGPAPSEAQVAAIIKAYDLNGDGQIEFGEFLAHYFKAIGGQPQPLREAFAKLDPDGDGRIELWELKAVLGSLFEQRLSSDAVNELVRAHDGDGDSRLTFSELAELLLGSDDE